MLISITNTGIGKLQAALVGGTKVQVTHFSIGLTSGTVGQNSTTVPGTLYGLVPVNSALKISSDSAQYECIVPETEGNYTFNVLGLWDQDGQLFAIGKNETDLVKTKSILPSILGNRYTLRAQIQITNISAVMSFILNVLTEANLNFVSIAKDLSGLASIGQYKTYRVVTMPDGYSDVATSNGSQWGFSRYARDYTRTTGALGSAVNKVRGNLNNYFVDDDVDSVIVIESGAQSGQVRRIISVDNPGNSSAEAVVDQNFAAAIASGVTYSVWSPKKEISGYSVCVAGLSSGRVTGDGYFLVWNKSTKGLAVMHDDPSYALHIKGSGFRLQKLTTPAAPTVTPQGVTGGSTYIYYIVAEDFRGNKTLVSNPTTINNGNSSLNVSNFNRITWPKIPGAYKYYVLRNSNTALIATITDPYVSSALPNSTYDDIGGGTSVFSLPSRNATADAIIDGQLSLGEDPINSLSAATKQYVDNRVLAVGTRSCFFQSVAPAGWTQDTSVNDRVIRISSGAGNVQGGTWTISGLTVGGHTLTLNEIPSHRHINGAYDRLLRYAGDVGSEIGDGNMPGGPDVNTNAPETFQGGGQAHDHPLGSAGTWRPAYIDAIICTKQ